MEGVLCDGSAAETPKEIINLSAHREGVFTKINFSTKERTPDREENLESKEAKAEVNGVNGSETVSNAEPPKGTDSAPQKTAISSPTLIGSAFKVMKNLFSPEKPKSIHSGVLSPINQQKNAAGPPCGSICVSGKTELFCTEPGISFQSGENFKNIQISETGLIQSPLTIDNLNNTDESFLTTVSLIDDSFHSAVTDFDDNGDPRLGSKTVSSNSQNLDFVDPYNDTLETNESYLENTTLKIGTPEGKSDNVSTVGCPNFLSGTQSFVIKIGDGDAIDNETLRIEGKLKAANGPADGKPDGTKTEKVEMANIFLNKSFEKSSSQQSGISVNDSHSYVVESWKKNEDESRGKESEVLFEAPNHDCFVGDSISTTTVVLESHHSHDLDNILVSLQSGDYEARPSSLISFGENPELTSSSENMEKPHAGEISLNNKQPSDCCDRWRCPPVTRLLSPQKKCVSEGNSPNNRANAVKIKLNKSDELINRRTSSEPPDGRNSCSVDISLMKNVESSELSEGFIRKDHQSEVAKTEISSPNKSEAAAITSQLSYTILINRNNLLNRPVIDSTCSFNSPESETFQEENSGKHPTDCSDGFFDRPSEMKQSTPVWSGNNEKSNQCFKPTPLKLYSPELKEANEIEKSPKSDLLSKAMEIFSSSETPLKFSPVSPGDGREKFLNSSDVIAHEVHTKKPGSPSVHRSPQKRGKPATPTKQIDTHKLNLTFEKSPNSPRSKKCNTTFVKCKELPEAEKTFDVPDPAHLNKTYDKQVGQLNQTFDLKVESLGAQKMNETFEKKRPESPLHSKISQVVGSCQEKVAQEMNKTFDSVPIAETTASKPAEETGKRPTKADDAPSKVAEPESNPSEIHKSDSSRDFNDSPGSSKNSISLVSSDLSTALVQDDVFPSTESIDLAVRLEKMNLGETVSLPGLKDPPDDQAEEKLLSSLKNEKLQYDPELVQLIQEQFSSNDIEKICSVVQDISTMKLSSDIIKASEQFDKSFHGNISEGEFKSEVLTEMKNEPANPLSPKSFDFLSSIGGKPTGRDWSRESLYVKFDPLVQPNSLIDFTKEGQALPPVEDSPTKSHNSSICEQLLTISPQKKPVDIVPPLTPLSHKSRTDENESRLERLKELQNEIYFLKNLYAEREKANKAKMDEYESQFTKLTADVCFLEDKLKESNEREKSLVKKVTEQTQNIGQLNVIMKEYMNVISKLTSELETVKAESAKQIENLSLEKDSYMTHLHNTEAAFTDVHTKYEKSKKTIASLKTNEAMFKNTIAEQTHKMEEFMAKVREVEEKASTELQKVHEELNEAKANHAQESARIRAQLRKTELKLEALQESLDQKVKENQQLTAICDELIEGKK